MADRKELTVSEQLDALKLEREKLELEKLRSDVAKLRADKTEAERKQAQQAQTIKQAEADNFARQGACAHKKGGRNLQGFVRGTDANHSVAKHQYPNGQIWVMCTRCNKEWKPGDPDYSEAMGWSTDNEMSTASLFSIPVAR